MRKLSSVLENKNTVAILGHVRPDGDCIGSCLATYNYITTWYPQIKVQVYLQTIPRIYGFLKGSDTIQSDFSEDLCYDLCIVQDCGALDRLGEAVKYFHSAKETFCIDHHISNDSFAMENHIIPDASSTSELIFDLMEEERITKEIAECIYTGIINDTGVFQYSCTSSKTMNIAGKLMEKGIDFTKIVDETFFTKSYLQNKIMGKVLLGSRLDLQDTCITGVVTKKEMEEFQVLPKDLDGIVNQLRVTRGVEVAIFLYELEEGRYKVSLRSNGKVNVAEIAKSLGGGGHIMAAGADMAGTSDTIRETLISFIKAQLFPEDL